MNGARGGRAALLRPLNDDQARRHPAVGRRHPVADLLHRVALAHPLVELGEVVADTGCLRVLAALSTGEPSTSGPLNAFICAVMVSSLRLSAPAAFMNLPSVSICPKPTFTHGSPMNLSLPLLLQDGLVRRHGRVVEVERHATTAIA